MVYSLLSCTLIAAYVHLRLTYHVCVCVCAYLISVNEARSGQTVSGVSGPQTSFLTLAVREIPEHDTAGLVHLWTNTLGQTNSQAVLIKNLELCLVTALLAHFCDVCRSLKMELYGTREA